MRASKLIIKLFQNFGELQDKMSYLRVRDSYHREENEIM